MLEYRSGNILGSDADVLVNPVNCVGTMGKGLAAQYAQRFPGILAPYRKACAESRLRPGTVQLLRLPDGRAVVNFPTKNHWRDPSRLEWIAAGLDALSAKMSRYGYASVAVPPLGCGLGGLSPDSVRPEVEQRLSGFHILFHVPERS